LNLFYITDGYDMFQTQGKFPDRVGGMAGCTFQRAYSNGNLPILYLARDSRRHGRYRPPGEADNKPG
jgi:hypothetical protein